MGTSEIYKYSYAITYDLQIFNENNNLVILLKVKDRSSEKQYNSVIKEEDIPDILKEHFPAKEKLFKFFADQRNFEIQPMTGIIYLLLQSSENKTIVTKRVPLQLIQNGDNMVTPVTFYNTQISKRQTMSEMNHHLSLESQTNSKVQENKMEVIKEEKEVQQQIPQYYKDEFDKKMRNFQEKMKTWKSQFDQKMTKIQGQMKWEYDKWQGKYIGQITKGIPNGCGVFIFENGDKIEGEWKEGKRNGKSIMYWQDGTKWESEWKNGQYHGKQIKYFNDGRLLEAQFKNGKKHGTVRLYNSKKKHEYDQVWQNGNKLRTVQ